MFIMLNYFLSNFKSRMKLQNQDTLDGLCDDAVELNLLVSQMKDLMVECKHIVFLIIKFINITYLLIYLFLFLDVNEGRKPGALVVEYKSPDELKKLIDLDLSYTGIGVSGKIPIFFFLI